MFRIRLLSVFYIFALSKKWIDGSRNTKPSVRNENLNRLLFTLDHLFLEYFAVRHAVSYGESGRELNLVAAEDKTEYEKDKLL